MSSSIHEIDAATAYDCRGIVRLVDVREPDEITGALGHIPGVEVVPLASIEAAAAGWDWRAPVVLICRSGRRSTSAAELLVRLGFQHVHNLTGGMLAYRAAGLPVDHG